jgi:hypothetical protein
MNIMSLKRISTLLFCSAFIIPHISSAAPPPQTRKELILRLYDAIANKDPAAIDRLYFWKDVAPDIRELHQEMFKTLVDTQVEDINFAPMTADYQTTIQEDGVLYNVNIPVRGLIRIKLFDDIVEQRGAITIPYGQVGTAYYLAGIRRDTEEMQTSKYNFYTISVQGLLFPNPVPFKGIYMYMKDGKQIKKRFQGEGFYKETVEADSFIACVAKKTSPDGWVKISIRKNGDIIFDAKETESEKPIVYKPESRL